MPISKKPKKQTPQKEKLKQRDGKPASRGKKQAIKKSKINSTASQPGFSDLTSLLQENRRLQRTIIRNQQQLEILRQSALKITSEISIDQIANTLVLTVANFFSADAVSCMLWDDFKQKFKIRAGVGLQKEYLDQQTIPVDRIQLLIQQNQDNFYFENLQENPQGNLALIKEENLYSVLTAWIKFGNEVFGVINVYSRGKVRRFTDEEKENAHLFAQQAAIAIHNAHLYREMQEEAQIAKTLRQMAEEVGRLNSLDEVLNRIIILIIRAVKFKMCAVFLWDDKKRLFIPAKAVGLPPHRSPLFNTLILREAEINFSTEELSQRLVVSAEGSPDRFPMEKFMTVLQTRDIRMVPLITKEKVLGMLVMAGYQGEHPFNHKDEYFLQGIAAEAAIGIDDANLFTALENAFWDIIKSLAAAIEVKDSYTHSHSESVSTYATALGEELGLSVKEMDLLSKACLVHDLGKIGIEDNILQKVTPLTFNERKNIERHPVIGSRILHSVSSLTDVAVIVHHHHEHFDGKGYPDHLVGEAAPLLARILSIADSFDAMTSDRPYRKALSYEEAVNELNRHAGYQFDPKLIEIFLRVLARKKVKWGFDKKDDGLAESPQPSEL